MTKIERIVQLASAEGDLSDQEFGELNVLLDRHCNTASPKLTGFLYDQPPMGWGFPPRYIKEGGKNTKRLARDTGALLSLLRHHPHDRALELCLQLSDRLTQLKTLHCTLDPDERIRYSCNIAGTETQRHACHKSNTGSGYNLHTTTGSHKHLFLADEGQEMWNLDLSGADGWTIGCECSALGDPTMLNDLRAGLKPAQAVCLIYEHGEAANKWEYPALLDAAKKIDKNGWLYMACKKGIWGTCYGMGDQKLIDVIADESYAETGTPTFVDVGAIRNMRAAVFARYPGIRRRMAYIDMKLRTTHELVCANGSKRQFLGKPDDHATRKEGYGHHPQVVTTWVTSLAWEKSWYDPENIRPDGHHIFQPLLLVHDSILAQAPVEHHDWVLQKLPGWFNNPVTIAGTTITIPFGKGFGPTWAHASGLR